MRCRLLKCSGHFFTKAFGACIDRVLTSIQFPILFRILEILQEELKSSTMLLKTVAHLWKHEMFGLKVYLMWERNMTLAYQKNSGEKWKFEIVAKL